MWWIAGALALEVTPTELPSLPVVAWTESTERGTELRVVGVANLEVDAPARLLAWHDGELTPGPQLTAEIVVLHTGEDRWWVHLPSGTKTLLPIEATLRHSTRDTVVFQEPSGRVWTSTLTSVPELTDLGVHSAVLGDFAGQLLLATGSQITEHPSMRTHDLGAEVPPGTKGWVDLNRSLHVVGLGVFELPEFTPSEVPPHPVPAPLTSTLAQRKGRLGVQRHKGVNWFASGAIEHARWWIPSVPVWNLGPEAFPGQGRCAELVGESPGMLCRTARGFRSFSDARLEVAEGRMVDCPAGQWISGSSHVTVRDPEVAQAWWCIDHHLQRRGPMLQLLDDQTFRTVP